MRIVSESDLKSILSRHRAWLCAMPDGARADLRSADLRSAVPRSADLRSADLSGADLSGADLSGADLRSADLSGADLRSADLRSAVLSGAVLSGAVHDDKTRWPAFLIVPETGSFRAWKKLAKDVICELGIPRGAKRVGGLVGRKCRAEYARVLALFTIDGKPFDGPGYSMYPQASTFKYVVGEIVRPDKFDPDFTVECSNGIHFLLTRQEAVEYC